MLAVPSKASATFILTPGKERLRPTSTSKVKLPQIKLLNSN